MTMARAFGLAAALLAMLAAGLWIGGHPGKMPPPLREVFVDSSAGLTAEAGELIERHYYRAVPDGELTDASLRGMVRALRRRYRDRFSEYFTPQVLRRFNEELSGRFTGIGLGVSQVSRGLLVERVFPGSPAERAGIVAGDTIVSVDGRPIAGLDSLEATALIKGPEGTDVTVGVRSREGEEGDGGGEQREVRLTRAEIEVPVVDSSLRRHGGERLGYVRLAAFSVGAHGAVRDAVRRLQRRGADGLLLDLRGNGGGLLEEAVSTAGVFLPEDEVVVTTRSRSRGERVYRTQGGNLPPLPLVVLIDRGTASAAEILAAALADNADAAVVGVRSFGKGVFQQEVRLSNGGALKLTVGEYFTPGGVSLADEGIRPDVAARDAPHTTRDEALRRALRALAVRAGGSR